ncbi:MAG: TIGR00300 family protein [Euryarchaeota archaeon]|nr:TIGR00300 family protein [Euryarchaeota archaeon]
MPRSRAISVREIELEGHIIDSNILPQVFDRIMELDGEFEVLQFQMGKKKTETSFARILVKGKNETHLDQILTEVHRLGARIPEAENSVLEEATADKVPPPGFYSTTHHPTYIHMGGRWLPVERIGMDCLIVVREGKALCVPLSRIRQGDRVVIGEKGVRVVPPERPRRRSLFEFMSRQVSTERPSKNLIRQISDELAQAKREGGRIAVVAGPAVVHTGGAPALAEMVRLGYVDVLLAGNALAVHDIEANLYGTSLGMDVKKAETVPGGHRHHIYAIAEILRHGSIAAAVQKGTVKGGILYECITHGVPFILAGSIRDDGPLPEVITDVVEAQEKMREALADVEIVLMMSTMLHSIAVGNKISSAVKTICIDINPSVVTKLMDRGTAQAIGIVTDVGTFLPALAEELRKQRKLTEFAGKEPAEAAPAPPKGDAPAEKT